MMKAVFVDVDNTILDFEACAKWAMEEVATSHQIPIYDNMQSAFKKVNDELWHNLELGIITKDDIFNTRWVKVLEELNIDFDGIQFEKEFVEMIHISHIPVVHAYEMLEYLSSQYDLYVISNASYAQQINRLFKAGMLSYFKGIFVSEKVGYEKPSVEFFKYCLETSHLNKEDCIVLGDSLHADMLGSIQSGIKTIWFNPNDEQTDLKIDYIIQDLLDIKDIL